MLYTIDQLVQCIFIGIGYATTVLFKDLQEGKHYIWSFSCILFAWFYAIFFLTSNILTIPDKPWQLWFAIIFSFSIFPFGIPVIYKCIKYWIR